MIESNNSLSAKNQDSSSSENKDKIKKLDLDSKSQDNFAVSPSISGSNLDTMPVPGGVQGQNPTQGLVHWMSAVMAEHMTSNTHHDPSAAVGMHYMWNGSVEVSRFNIKDMISPHPLQSY